MKKPFITVALIGLGLLLGCDGAIIGGSLNITGDNPTDFPPDPNLPPPPPPPLCTTTGRVYIGFGGSQLTVGRVEQVVGVDRARVKPYSALVSTTSGTTTTPGEFQRVMGNSSALLTASASTYDDAPNRWFIEPQGSAVNI